MPGFIFLCSNATETECLKKQLLGGKKDYQRKVGTIHVGDTLFLYNFSSFTLYGPFTATSPSALDIDPHAWDGGFPFQVQFSKKKECIPLTRADVEKLLSFTKGKPPAKLSKQVIDELHFRFTSPIRAPRGEYDYRKDNPAEIFTDDGHLVRSNAEKIIDNWLYANRIIHTYEPQIGNGFFSDFFISLNDNTDVYVEYWGLHSAKYLQRRKEKLQWYKENRLIVISLEPKDLDHINEILPKRFLDSVKKLKQKDPRQAMES